MVRFLSLSASTAKVMGEQKYLFGILPAFSALKIFAIDLPLDDPRAGGQEAKEGRTMLRRQLASRLPFLQELYVGRQLKRYVVH